MQQTKADAIAIQEHKMNKKEIKRHTKIAAKAGFKAYATQCKGQGRHRSGGVLIHWKKHLVLTAMPQVITQHRAVVLPLKLATIGTVHIVALYGVSGETLTAGSEMDGMLNAIREYVEIQHEPFVVAADLTNRPTP